MAGEQLGACCGIKMFLGPGHRNITYVQTLSEAPPAVTPDHITSYNT